MLVIGRDTLHKIISENDAESLKKSSTLLDLMDGMIVAIIPSIAPPFRLFSL